MPTFTSLNENNHTFEFRVDRYPDICPICDTGNVFILICAYLHQDFDTPYVQAVFRCPRHKCQALFFAYYGTARYKPTINSGDVLFLQKTNRLQYGEEPTFPNPIAEISPQFVKIYFQASIAEENSLDEISGVGYGKALEFLIKDYLIHLHPDEKETIAKETHLGVLIDRFEDPDMQTVADRAAWLRNDETHYLRKWKEQDLQDLKNLIELTSQHIRRVELTKDYNKKMNPEKKKDEKENPA